MPDYTIVSAVNLEPVEGVEPPFADPVTVPTFVAPVVYTGIIRIILLFTN
jgi:hypothetical protein